jgi:5-formyltetrahydrofolate cyclo-ligase
VSDFSRRSKAEVRATVLAARRARATASADERADDDRAIRHGLVGLAAGRRTVAAYVPLGTEPGGAPLPEALASVCDRLLVPLMLPDRDLDWTVYEDDARLSSAGWEPLRQAARLGPAAIAEADLVIVPAVAVDRSGVRLGRGGGSYDRALARVPEATLIVAALYHDELVAALPFEDHDRRVHAVVTPSGVTRL